MGDPYGAIAEGAGMVTGLALAGAAIGATRRLLGGKKARKKRRKKKRARA